MFFSGFSRVNHQLRWDFPTGFSGSHNCGFSPCQNGVAYYDKRWSMVDRNEKIVFPKTETVCSNVCLCVCFVGIFAIVTSVCFWFSFSVARLLVSFFVLLVCFLRDWLLYGRRVVRPRLVWFEWSVCCVVVRRWLVRVFCDCFHGLFGDWLSGGWFACLGLAACLSAVNTVLLASLSLLVSDTWT